MSDEVFCTKIVQCLFFSTFECLDEKMVVVIFPANFHVFVILLWKLAKLAWRLPSIWASMAACMTASRAMRECVKTVQEQKAGLDRQ